MCLQKITFHQHLVGTMQTPIFVVVACLTIFQYKLENLLKKKIGSADKWSPRHEVSLWYIAFGSKKKEIVGLTVQTSCVNALL